MESDYLNNYFGENDQFQEDRLEKHLDIRAVFHDLNNLFTSIIGNLSILKEDLKFDPNFRVILNDMDLAAKQACKLSKKVLKSDDCPCSHLESNSIDNINYSIKEIAAMLLRKEKIQVIYDLDEILHTIYIDKSEFYQILSNLIINSVQAMQLEGFIFLKTEYIQINDNNYFNTLVPGRHIKITVSDDGEGIEEEDLPKIFKPNFTTKINGSGLGLYTVKSIIDKIHGHINVKSIKGLGTEFEIYLPAYETL
jgi:signal transduction histidine kinase